MLLQIYTVVLLVFLFLWMDPLGAFVVLLPLSSAVTVNETALWISDLMKSSAQQGENCVLKSTQIFVSH